MLVENGGSVRNIEELGGRLMAPISSNVPNCNSILITRTGISTVQGRTSITHSATAIHGHSLRILTMLRGSQLISCKTLPTEHHFGQQHGRASEAAVVRKK